MMEVSLTTRRAVGQPGNPGGLNVVQFSDTGAAFHVGGPVNMGWLRDALMEQAPVFDAIVSADPGFGPLWLAAKAQVTGAGMPLDELVEALRRAVLVV